MSEKRRVRQSDIWLITQRGNLGEASRVPIGCLMGGMIGCLFCHVIVVYFTSKSPILSSVRDTLFKVVRIWSCLLNEVLIRIEVGNRTICDGVSSKRGDLGYSEINVRYN